MANEVEIRKLASENAQLREDWLNHANEVAGAIPWVQKAMRWDVLCANAFGTTPSGYNLPNTERLHNQLVLENNYLKTNQPNLSQNTLSYAATGSAVGYSVGTEAASLLTGYAQNGTTEIKVWANEHLDHFAQPLHEDTFISIICKKLDLLYPGLTKEFEDAMKTTRSVIAGAAINSSAGVAMRNVLENLKGNMLHVARQRSGNKNMSKWEEAARGVAKGGSTSFEANQLVAKEADWKQLWDATTHLAKNNSKMTLADLEAAYYRWLGLVQIVLSFIELHDGT